MMSIEQFYATLPSNASMDVFPENTLHSYKIKLQKPLSVDQGKWVVGMTEIQFPRSWRNIISGTVQVRSAQQDNPLIFHLKDGLYNTIEELLDNIQLVLRGAKLEKQINLSYDNIRNQVRLQVTESFEKTSIGITFSQNILNILGFSRVSGEYFSSGIFVGGAADITEGFSALYVYCDLVQNQLVGDAQVPLLRAVPIQTHKEELIEWIEFQHVQYIPVGHTQTDVIEVNIRRDNGDTVPFQRGKVIITLHFKRLQ